MFKGSTTACRGVSYANAAVSRTAVGQWAASEEAKTLAEQRQENLRLSEQRTNALFAGGCVRCSGSGFAESGGGDTTRQAVERLRETFAKRRRCVDIGAYSADSIKSRVRLESSVFF